MVLPKKILNSGSHKKSFDAVFPQKILLIQWSPKKIFWYSGPKKKSFDTVFPQKIFDYVVPKKNLLIQWSPQNFDTVFPQKKSFETVVPQAPPSLC